MPDVIIPGPEGRLEGRYHQSKTPNSPIALLLHPHPQHGGTMNNKIVYQLYHVFARRGFSTLRFNFRGVGRSQGSYDRGEGELSDAAAALDWLQGQNLTAEDFGGPDLEGCNENLVLTRPDVILRMHGDYLAAGADMVETDTFGGTPLVLAEYGLADKAIEINRRAAELAREAAAAASTSSRLRFVAGSMGPTTKAMTVTGGVTFEVRKVDVGVGCAASRGIAVGLEGVYFVGADGVYLTTGGPPRKISEEIDPIFRDDDFVPWFTGGSANGDLLNLAAMTYHKKRLYLAYSQGDGQSVTWNDRVLVYGNKTVVFD